MTKDQLPEKLRNMHGLEMIDPANKEKKLVMLSEATMEVLEREFMARKASKPA